MTKFLTNGIIDYIVYAVIIAWSSLITWFVTKRKIKQEQLEMTKIDNEHDFLKRQNSLIDHALNQNEKITHLIRHFQDEIGKLHQDVIELRVENNCLKYEISQLNDTIKLLVQVNDAEKTFIGEKHV
jgi:peptidoglycan hydrolase CwlO-like protein